MTGGRVLLTMAWTVLALLLAAGALDAEDLTEETYARWRDHVLPKPEEMRWQAILWRTTFWEAVVEAQEKDRPILFWTMNGHPLGCT